MPKLSTCNIYADVHDNLMKWSHYSYTEILHEKVHEQQNQSGIISFFSEKLMSSAGINHADTPGGGDFWTGRQAADELCKANIDTMVISSIIQSGRLDWIGAPMTKNGEHKRQKS